MTKYILTISFVLTGLLLHSQCYPDRHSTSWFDAWISCEKAQNPKAEYGESHWIMYDLSDTYELGEAHLWNINDPAHLDRGVYKALVDVSLDGTTWYTLDTLFVDQGPGVSIYEGEEVYDFDGEIARFVLLTIVETHGDENCGGFSEWRIERRALTTSVAEEEQTNTSCLTAQISPNPFVDHAMLTVQSGCGGDIEYHAVNAIGKVMFSGEFEAVNGVKSLDIGQWQLPAGQYVLHLEQGDQVENVVITRIRER